MSTLTRYTTAAFVFAAALAGQADAASDPWGGDCAGLPCVKVQSGAPLTLMIDTGNPLSILNVAKAKELGLALSPFVNRHGQTVPGASVAHLQNIEVGGITIPDLKVAVFDLSKSMSDGTFPKVDGTIGYGALKGYTLSLDYREQTVHVAPAGGDCGSFCGTITYPTFGKNGPPIVVASGFKVNGQDVSVQVDTMYTGTMLIFPTSVAKLRLKAQSASTRTEHFLFTDGGVDMIVGRAEAEDFGSKTLLADAPLYFATPGVHTPDGLFDGTVGAALFDGHVVHMDFGSDRFWMD